jgi:S-(hydroxymethyl)glutathione dehydrogenase / alcohol dehydrogenase
MRAAVFQETGQEKVDILDNVEVVDPQPGDVKIRMRATGVCHSDISAMNGTIPQPAPCVLGHEGAGEIVEVGEGVTKVAPGDHVIVVWVPPCGECRTCLRGQPNLCPSSMAAMGNQRFSVDGTPFFGFAGTGTFAEESVMPQQAVVKIPDDVPFEIGALIGCGVTTGVGAALNTAKVEPGSSVAVIGAGGVGISVIQGARIAGASEIVAIDMMESKLETAKRFGATHGATPDTIEDVKNEITAGEGFDYAFEVVGRSETVRQAYDLVRRGGSAVVVGAGRMDDEVRLNCFELFYMEKKLIGSLYGSADVRVEFPRLINLWRNGRLDLDGMISSRLKLDDVNDAFEAMETGDVIRQIIHFD